MGLFRPSAQGPSPSILKAVWSFLGFIVKYGAYLYVIVDVAAYAQEKVGALDKSTPPTPKVNDTNVEQS